MKKLIFVLMLFCGTASAQIEVKHFNAGWNDANAVSWYMDLEDVI